MRRRKTVWRRFSYNLVEGICIGATLLESFMPETSQRILDQLHAEKRTYEQLDTFGLYTSGNKVTDQPVDPLCPSGCKRGSGEG